MLRHTKDIQGFKLSCINGELGKIKDIYFDDFLWVIRYMVVDTGRWLPRRTVLISPESLGEINEYEKKIEVKLTKEIVEKSPAIFPDQPLLRKEELALSGYYSWSSYWETITLETDDVLRLQSVKEVSGYTIEAIDGEVGSITNFIIDDNDWSVKYMVVDPNKIIPGRKVLLALDWIEQIDEQNKKIIVNVRKDLIESAPEYNPETPVNRTVETELFDYYKKEHTWT